MESPGSEAGPISTLSFEAFWSWLIRHPNCIDRAGTPDAALFDDDDLHWHFAADGGRLYVQVIRGKRLLGELLLEAERVSYVQVLPEEHESDHLFELVAESDDGAEVLYFFVMAHGPDEEEETSDKHGPAVH